MRVGGCQLVSFSFVMVAKGSGGRGARVGCTCMIQESRSLHPNVERQGNQHTLKPNRNTPTKYHKPCNIKILGALSRKTKQC